VSISQNDSKRTAGSIVVTLNSFSVIGEMMEMYRRGALSCVHMHSSMSSASVHEEKLAAEYVRIPSIVLSGSRK
jgi:hypothetical protein